MLTLTGPARVSGWHWQAEGTNTCKREMTKGDTDREEIITAGDAYYLQPGQFSLYEEDTEVVEFSPKGEYEEH